jgi:PAS domain S-box-containing protein
VLPLKDGENVFGAITIYAREPDPFTPDEVELLGKLADDLAYGLTALRLRAAHAQAEAALAASEAKFRSAFANAAIGFAMTDPDGRFLDSNPAYSRITGYSLEELRKLDFPRLIHPDDAAANMRQIERMLKGEIPDFVVENRYCRKDGTFVWVRKSVSLVRDASEAPQWIIALVEDITVRRQAEERLQESLSDKVVLLKEIHHRVKNNLQVISSLVDLQSDNLDPAMREMFQDVRDRVRTMALVHEKLYQSENLASVQFDEYARSLLQYLWRAHSNSETSIGLSLDLLPVTFSVETAVPFGLILNELAVNALKHAFVGRSEGTVVVVLRTDENGRVRLRVADNGVGMPAGLDWRNAQSLGLRLVQMLTRQLNGTVEANCDVGTEFVISFTTHQ